MEKYDLIKNSKQYSFMDFPKIIPLHDYKQVKQEIIAKARNSKEIISIYFWGLTNHPGISDIDPIIITKEKIRLSSLFWYDSKKQKEVQAHSGCFIPLHLAKQLRIVFANYPFHHYWGEKVQFPLFHDKHDRETNLLNDMVIKSFPRCFLNPLLTKKIFVRSLLLKLYSLTHSFNEFYRATKKYKKEWKSYKRKITSLRNQWFTLNQDQQKEQLLQVTQKALEVSLDLIQELHQFLLSEYHYKIYSKEKIIYTGENNNTIFVNNWNPEKSLAESRGYYKKTKKIAPCLPKELSLPLFYYSQCNGLISDYIRKNLKANIGSFSCDLDNIFIQRGNFFNQHMKYVFDNKLRYGCYFTYGYRPYKGIINRGVQIFRLFKKNPRIIP